MCARAKPAFPSPTAAPSHPLIVRARRARMGTNFLIRVRPPPATYALRSLGARLSRTTLARARRARQSPTAMSNPPRTARARLARTVTLSLGRVRLPPAQHARHSPGARLSPRMLARVSRARALRTAVRTNSRIARALNALTGTKTLPRHRSSLANLLAHLNVETPKAAMPQMVSVSIARRTIWISAPHARPTLEKPTVNHASTGTPLIPQRTNANVVLRNTAAQLRTRTWTHTVRMICAYHVLRKTPTVVSALGET